MAKDLLPFNRLSPRSSPEELVAEITAAFESEEFEKVLELYEALPRALKREPMFLMMRASALVSEGDELAGLAELRELERKNPRFWPVYQGLAGIYLDLEWPSLALTAAKRALSNRDLSAEERAILETWSAGATKMIEFEANRLGLSFEAMQKASGFNEQAQFALNSNDLPQADYYAREAIKIAPHWNSPYNNRSRALFYAGRIQEAIAVEEIVLARSPKEVFAISSLVLYLIGIGQEEKARSYAALLAEMGLEAPADGAAIEQIIAALALVEDTAALWKIARRLLASPAEDLADRSWACLAVAAIRSQKWKEARQLFQNINIEETNPATKELLEEVSKTAGERKPRLKWMPPAYPVADMLLHPKALREVDSIIRQSQDEETLSPSQRRKLQGVFQRYPYLFAALKRLLRDPEGSESAAETLVLLALPQADALLTEFAFGQEGSLAARSHAIIRLIQEGRYSGDKRVTLWNDEKDEWQTVELNTQQIGPTKTKAQPKTVALMEKGRQAKTPEEQISFYRKAVEGEPTSPVALFNLGVTLIQNNQEDEGLQLVHRSVEVDPDYSYGHAMIALNAAELGSTREAREHLDIVQRAELIDPETAVIANLALAALAMRKHDLPSVRQQLDIVKMLDDEHPILKDYEERLEKLEQYQDVFGSMLDHARASNERGQQKIMNTPLAADMTIHACLERYTRDALAGMCQYLAISTAGKKAELGMRIEEALLDEDTLQWVVDELDEKEKSALRWVLEKDGVGRLDEFVSQYDTDFDESPNWYFHAPESIPADLKRAGLIFTGTLDGEKVVFLPPQLREKLRGILE